MATVTPSRPESLFNLPNQLTAARLVLAVILFVLIAFGHWIACLVVFAVAAATDWLDGLAARKLGLSSSFGRSFDPLVDKVLVCGAYIFLMQVDGSGLAPWMVTVVVCRELLITGLRGYLENLGVVFGADLLGKLKMVLQCAALIVIFVALQAPSWSKEWATACDWLRIGLIYAMLVATALSGLQYVWRAAMMLRK